MTVRELLEQRTWKPIRHCPGRFVLVTDDRRVSLDQLLGSGHALQVEKTDRASDTVLVAPLEDGGVISFARADGTLVHTLNTPDGFRRKLTELAIPLRGGPMSSAASGEGQERPQS